MNKFRVFYTLNQEVKSQVVTCEHPDQARDIVRKQIKSTMSPEDLVKAAFGVNKTKRVRG